MSTLPYPNSPLHDVMRATAARHPDRRAITFKGAMWSFAQFDLDSNRFANGLAALGLGFGDRMSLYLPNCPQYELGFYAASKLGAIACPLNPSYRERELIYQVTDSGATVMLTHASLWPVVEASRAQIGNIAHFIVVGDGPPAKGAVSSYDNVIGGARSEPPSVRVDPDQVVALPYSSGTTGLPKGVMLTHWNLVCNHMQFGTASRLGPTDAYPVYLPLSHIYGVALMGLAMWSGAHQILMERFDLEAIVSAIQEHRATWLHTRFRCVSITPFGRPVVPLEYGSATTWSGSTRTAGGSLLASPMTAS